MRRAPSLALRVEDRWSPRHSEFLPVRHTRAREEHTESNSVRGDSGDSRQTNTRLCHTCAVPASLKKAPAFFRVVAVSGLCDDIAAASRGYAGMSTWPRTSPFSRWRARGLMPPSASHGRFSLLSNYSSLSHSYLGCSISLSTSSSSHPMAQIPRAELWFQ